MDGSAALDTNTVIPLVNGDIHLRELGFDRILVPMTVVGELFYGIHKSRRLAENRRRLFAFLDRVTLLETDVETTELYGQIKARLHRSGGLIPENDMWITATAMRYRLPLLTNDHHFDRVEGLITIPWHRPN